MSEVENREQTVNNGMDIGGSPAQRLPAPGSDPFGGDDSDEITIIGGRPDPAKDTKLTQQSDFDENNIDFDELLSDNVPTNDGDGQTLGTQPRTQEQVQPQDAEPKKDFKAAIDDYGMQVVDGLFNAEQFAKQLGEADPQAIAMSLKQAFNSMYQRSLQDALLVARKFADDAIKSAMQNQSREFTAREQAQILKSTLAPYPDLKKAQYRPVVQTVYEKALAKGKNPQEAANLVVAYFKKNIPNAIQEPTQAKQTDGSSINDDIWANFR